MLNAPTQLLLRLSFVWTQWHTAKSLIAKQRIRFLLVSPQIQPDGLHRTAGSSRLPAVLPDVRHAGSQMCVLERRVALCGVGASWRPSGTVHSLIYRVLLFVFIPPHGCPPQTHPLSSPHQAGELGLSAKTTTSPPPLSPNGLTSHLSKIIYAVQGPPPCESVRLHCSHPLRFLILCKTTDVIRIRSQGSASHAPQQTHAVVHGGTITQPSSKHHYKSFRGFHIVSDALSL